MRTQDTSGRRVTTLIGVGAALACFFLIAGKTSPAGAVEYKATTAASSSQDASKPETSAHSENATAEPEKPANGATEAALVEELTMKVFLDRLMRAESGGRLNARNPRSTALGPYQFIASTWLMIANKHFTKEMEGLRADQVLALRTDLELSRRAAEIYTHQNAAYLVAQGHKATFPNLRLAFLVGPSAAARVLSAPEKTAASTLLGGGVIAANPFMARLTASGLIARAARDILADPGSLAGVTPDPALVRAANGDGANKRPAIAVPCELSLPSCRRWLALAQRRANRKQRRASR
ncbi:MAG: hypothetical protein KDJ17_10995 [Hyphomicrobiaceae bacterium]|nr:hypothetical protein [Hyphomicrobiaceae bacterium]